MSLRVRLTLFFALFLALVLSVVAVVVYGLTQRSLLDSVETRADQALADALEAIHENPGIDRPISRNSWVQNLSGDVRLFVNIYTEPQALVGNEPFFEFERVPGMSVVVSNPAQNAFDALSEADYQVLVQRGVLATQVTDPNGNPMIVRAQREVIQIGGFAEDLSAPALVMVWLPLETGTLTQLRTNLLQTILLAFVIFTLGVWFLSRQVLAPLKRVTSAASRVSSQDLSQRVPVPRSRDEVWELSTTLNRMLERLQETFDTQRRFTADASHELRTPVTAIAGHVNYLLRRTKPSAEQIESLNIIRDEAGRMGKLVNDLLELARADAGFKVEKEPMNLVEVVEAVGRELAPVSGSATLEVSSPQPLLEVMGDAARLKQVVLNLVQNALNAGSTVVSVSLTQEGNSARLEVLDNGPGIPEAAIPNLFERFYRVDGARSTRGNGSGLGLAIVKWIVEQHGGEVTVESKVGEGTVFTVLLPALSGPKRQP